MDKASMDSMRQQQQAAISHPPNFANRNLPNPNDRVVQENLNRMMEANKNVFIQYPNYGPYVASPYAGMNQMHMPQFRNQMQYSMPPPGGIPYMMHGYHEPYAMSNLQPRYGPTVVDDLKEYSKSKASRNEG